MRIARTARLLPALALAATLMSLGASNAPPSAAKAPPDVASTVVETIKRDDEKKSGLEVVRRSGGSVQATVTWKDGKRDGPVFEYNEKGKCITAGQFTAGEKSGTWRQWSDCGELKWETPYVAGKKEGVRTQWVNDCDPKTEQSVGETLTFKDDIKQGPCVSYWSGDRTVSARGEYDKGEKHGTWETYYRDGSPMKTIVYDHGEKVSETDHRK